MLNCSYDQMFGGVTIKLEIFRFKRCPVRSEMKSFMRKRSEAEGTAYLSRSYSGNYAALMKADVPVAVDIEKARILSTKDQLGIIRFACNIEDMILLESGVELLQIWTMKEAYAKYLLRGVEIDFRKIHIHPIGHHEFVGEHRDYQFIRIRSWFTEELVIAVAVGTVKECFSKFKMSEVVVEHEY